MVGKAGPDWLNSDFDELGDASWEHLPAVKPQVSARVFHVEHGGAS